ncbi:hypothetical protein BDY19DRAFT_957076 [Irpex rosettiformis]|uniref:Uncharacterized protein n=1 Tax=Irpex rosettiformis TaxID=378272 RepID=A0ACB8TY00_9APHY|nr:hypothetical protein BDY19DRAFT_957076 [Irpex rosettiformis]
MNSSYIQRSAKLPPNDYDDNETHTAYDHCLWLEKFDSWNTFVDETVSEEVRMDMPPAIAARVLGYAIRVAPNDSGRNALVSDILACGKSPELLAGVAHFYVYGLCRIFYNPFNGLPSRPIPDGTPRLSLEAIEADQSLLSEYSSDRARLRIQTLLRDNNRCVFTGCLDYQQFVHEWKVTGGKVHPCTCGPTNVAHIISQSLLENISGINPAVQAKFEWARTAGAMLQHFGGFKAHNLSDEILHSPKNAFTASLTPLVLFEDLKIWLTPVKDVETQAIIPNTYRLNHYLGNEHIPFGIQDAKSEVNFRSISIGGIVIPPPDPQLIVLHGVCAEIVCKSDAMDYLEERYKDIEPFAAMTASGAVNELTRVLKTMQMAADT